MLKLFQVCFFTGLFYAIISFLLGHIFEFAGVDADVDIDGGVDIDVDLDGGFSAGSVSPLKPIVIASFVLVFGGVGIICLKKSLTEFVALILALSIGFLIAFILYRFLVVPLYRAQNTSAVSHRELIGTMAKVTLAIKGKAYGKIQYIVNGNTYGAPTKSVDDTDIEKGADVVIIEINKNTFYVKKIKGGI